MIEAPDPYGMVPISTSNMYKVMEIRSLGSIITRLPQLLLEKTFDSSQIATSHLYIKRCHGAVFEAPDPHGMLPTSTSNMCKVMEIIHTLLLWRMVSLGSIITPSPQLLLIYTLDFHDEFHTCNVKDAIV